MGLKEKKIKPYNDTQTRHFLRNKRIFGNSIPMAKRHTIAV